ncbi:uncharacterized protein O3C94_007575 [Discoglossus pictus]
MPISSGGEGHVGFGVDTSIIWIPDGGEDFHRFKSRNSYLQRYLCHHAGGGIRKSGKKTEGNETLREYKRKNSQVASKDNYTKDLKEHERRKEDRSQDHQNKSVSPDSDMNATKSPKQLSNTAPKNKSSVCIIL